MTQHKEPNWDNMQSEILAHVLLFLNETDLTSIITSCRIYDKSKQLEEAAMQAFRNSIRHNESHPQYDASWYHKRGLYNTPKTLVDIIEETHRDIDDCHHFTNLQKLVALQFGPTIHVRLNVFLGRALEVNLQRRRRWFCTYKHVSMGLKSRGLATTTHQMMNHGQHFISFKFINAIEGNRDLSYDIGIMRPLPREFWDELVQSDHGSFLPYNFYVYRNTDMQLLNRGRTPLWQGSIDCCTINPRAPYIRWACWGNNLGIATNEKTDLMGNFVDVDAKHMEQCGLLLDLDRGTLSYYKNGFPINVIKSGLRGPYTWMVSFKGNRNCQADLGFSCKTY